MYQKWLYILEGIPLFGGINSVNLEHMLGCLAPKITTFKKGETIRVVEEVFDGLGIVLAGNVTVTKENEVGERLILAKLDAGNIFGEMIAFSGKGVWPATVYANEASTIMFLPPERMITTCQESCSSHNQLIMNMLRIISQKALLLNRKVEYLSIKSMRRKLVTFLMESHHQSGQLTFMIPLSRNELAEFLNVSRPSMSREIGRMKDEGLIDYYQNSFKILDKEALLTYLK